MTDSAETSARSTGPGESQVDDDSLVPKTHLGNGDSLAPPTHLGGAEDLAPPTKIGPVQPPTPPEAPAPAADSSALPATLGARFEIVSEYLSGGEANVFHVRDVESGGDAVVKLYHRGIEIDEDLYRIVKTADDTHVVHLQEWGRVDGRAYEVLDYMPLGTLVDLIRNEGPSFSSDVIETVVRELIDALEHLSSIAEQNQQRFVHRDLKPANIMVRERTPMDLVLSDFGSSLLTERSRTLVDARHTYEYAAPEIIMGQTHSQKSDLWSIGVIAYLMSVGSHPLSGLETVQAITFRVTIDGIDTDVVEDPRVRLLCQGLLTIKVEDRWGYGEVREWLAGGSPATHQRAAVANDSVAFEFGGKEYFEPSALAVAMAANWSNAARTFQGPSGRYAIETWLERSGHSEAVRNVLRDWEQTEGASPDRRIALMLKNLAPDTTGLPFRQWQIDATGLAALASAAVTSATNETPEAQAVSSLHDNALLPLYAGLAGGNDLGPINDRWVSAAAQFAAATAGREGAQHSNLQDQQRAARTVQARLLLAATSQAESDRLLTQARSTAGSTDSSESPWFKQLASSIEGTKSSTEVIGSAAAIEALAPIADMEAANAREAAAAARRAEADRKAELARRNRAERQRQGEGYKGADVHTVKWVVGLLLTGLVPYMFGVGVVYLEADKNFRGYKGAMEALEGLPVWEFFKTFWLIGAGVVLVLAALRLFLRRHLKFRPFGTTMAASFLLVGGGLLLARGSIFGDAADAAARDRAASPIPTDKIADHCPGPGWWTGTTAPTRTVVAGDQCNEVRQYDGRSVDWATPVWGTVGDLMGMGPVFLARAADYPGVTALDKNTGAILWLKVCESSLMIDESMADNGSSTPTNQRFKGTCDGIPFDLDPKTGA